MDSKVLVFYKSVTGFTKQYAEMIAGEIDCTLMDLKDVTAEKISEYDIVVFGGRFHAGSVDGLKKAKGLVNKSKVKTFIVFATGAMPNSAEDTIEESWKNNFTSDELHSIPHFYMQGGLRYENMPLLDKLMMKGFAAMMKKNKDKNPYGNEIEQAISSSYDISSKTYIEPLVSYIKDLQK